MRSHLIVPIVALLGACGRFGFDGVDPPDARPDDAAPGSYTAAVLADGPRVYYRLGDLGGPTITDAVGTAHAAIDVDMGTLSFGRPGALAGDADSAIQFSGDGNLGPRVAAWARRDDLWLRFGGDFTVEVFVRPIKLPPSGFLHSILLCEDYLVNGFRTGWDPQGNLSMWTDQAGATGDLDTPTVMTIGTWYHVAFIRRGTMAEIVVDGVSVAQAVWPYVPPTTESECGFGSFHGMPSETELDELAIYDVALTPAQLAAHVAASR